MHYHSTQSQSPALSFSDALIQGLAPDGGLYLPESVPTLSADVVSRFPEKSFYDIAFEILSPFIGDEIPADDLRPMIATAFNFPVPLTPIHDNITLVELWHGPTLAFKDFAARFMARAMSYFSQNDEKITILVATSGDTGGAIAHAYLGLPGVEVKIFYPSGKVSHLQEQQLTTMGQNITAYEVDGTFDECQQLVKDAFRDEELNQRLNLTSANSINVGRLLPQATYHAYAFSRIMNDAPDTQICVPSGNFGNLCAGLIARQMGVPIPHYLAANNINNPVCDYLNTGRYNARPSQHTLSNAMDIGAPSNFARMENLLGGHDALSAIMAGETVTDDDTRTQMKATYEESGVVVDPHTAVGIRAVQQYRERTGDHRPTLVLSTAHAAKFKPDVDATLNIEIDVPNRLAQYANRRKQAISMPPNLEELKRAL